MGQPGAMFSHGASFGFELAGVGDEAVGDGVGEGGVAEQLMPLAWAVLMNYRTIISKLRMAIADACLNAAP